MEEEPSVREANQKQELCGSTADYAGVAIIENENQFHLGFSLGPR